MKRWSFDRAGAGAGRRRSGAGAGQGRRRRKAGQGRNVDPAGPRRRSTAASSAASASRYTATIGETILKADGRHAEGGDRLHRLRQGAARSRAGRSPSCSTAARARARSGCRWAPSGRSGSRSRPTRATTARRPIRSSTIPTACSTSPTSSSSIRSAPASATRSARPSRKEFCGVTAGRQVGRRVHPPLAQRERPLELAQISRRRELRHDPLGGGRQPARGRPTTTSR